MKSPVHRRARQQLVVEQRRPFRQGAVGRDDGRAPLVSLPNDLVQVDGLVPDKQPETEVVDDGEVSVREPLEFPLTSVVRSGCPELGQHSVRGRVQHGVGRDAGAVTDLLCDVALPDAGRPDDADVLSLVDEGARGQIDDLAFGSLGVDLATVISSLPASASTPSTTHAAATRLSQPHRIRGDESSTPTRSRVTEVSTFSRKLQ